MEQEVRETYVDEERNLTNRQKLIANKRRMDWRIQAWMIFFYMLSNWTANHRRKLEKEKIFRGVWLGVVVLLIDNWMNMPAALNIIVSIDRESSYKLMWNRRNISSLLNLPRRHFSFNSQGGVIDALFIIRHTHNAAK